MPNFTTRLGLSKDLETEQYDVGRVNTNSDKIDEYVGATVCTSTTRPTTGLFNGRIAYETDTSAAVVYRSGAWRYLGLPTAASAAVRDALTPRYDGMAVWRIDKDMVEIWNGSAWRAQGSHVLRGRRLSSAWTDLGGGETDLFDMSLDNVPIEIGQRVIFHADLYVNCTTTTSWLFKFRKTTAVTGPLLAQRMLWLGPAGAADQAVSLHIPWLCDETAVRNFKFSVERFGSGLLDISSSNNSYTWVSLEDGPSGAWS